MDANLLQHFLYPVMDFRSRNVPVELHVAENPGYTTEHVLLHHFGVGHDGRLDVHHGDTVVLVI